MERRSVALVVFGIVLLVIGLFASFYESKYYDDYDQRWESYNPPRYPYQTVGIILLVAGIVIAVLGFVLPKRKLPPPPSSSS